MTDTRRRSFWFAVLLAVLYDGFTLALGWLLLGPPPTMAKMPFFKATVTVGLPSVSQLMDAHHQVLSVHAAHTAHSAGSNTLVAMIVVSFLTLVVYTFINGCYLSLLGRSVQPAPKRTAWADGVRAFGPLFVWMLVQMLVSAVLAVLTAFGNVGFAIMVVLLLLFRYWFLFLEYALVVRSYDLRRAFALAPKLRRQVERQAALGFLSFLAVNIALAELLNLTFSVLSLAAFVLINSFVMTVLQRRLLVRFLNVDDKGL